MPAKKASGTKKAVAATKVSAKSKKAPTKTSRSLKNLSLQQRLSTFLSSVSADTKTSVVSKGTAKTKSGLIGRRFFLPLVGLLVLLGLAYLASRYLIIAWVDNKPISRLTYYNQLDQKYGKDLKEQLIVEKLIESEAQKKGMTVTNEELAAELKKIADEQGGQDKLNQILQLQGISQDELKRLVKLQLLRQKIFGEGQVVTDAEVNNYFAQNKENILGAQTNPDASTEAKLKENVKRQLLQQRLNATFSAWLQENLKSNRVVRVQ